MEVYGYIYLVRNKVNGKMYFGKTENNFKKRYSGNIAKHTHNEHLKNSINTYGIENFEIIEQFDVAYNEDDLYDLEDMYMCIYNTLDNRYGYNKQRSGRKHKGRGKHSEESKIKMSEAQKGEKNPMFGVSPKERMDEETYEQWLYKQQTMERHGEANPNYGKKWNEEQRIKASQTQKEIAQREDYVNPFKGHKHTEEWKQKYFYGEANPMYGKCGELNPFYDKHHTKEARRKISEARGGRQVICLETLEVFPSATSACKWAKVKTGVAACCKGKQPRAGGYHWMYYDEYLEQQNKENSNPTNNKIA